MVDFEDPPDPPGSPIEKIKTARERLLEPINIRDFLRYRSEADPQLERILTGVMEEYDRRKNENMMRWLDEEEKWLNRHVHGGGTGFLSASYIDLMETLGPRYWWRMEETSGLYVAHDGLSENHPLRLELSSDDPAFTNLNIDGVVGSGVWLKGGSNTTGNGYATSVNEQNEHSIINTDTELGSTPRLAMIGWFKHPFRDEVGPTRLVLVLFAPSGSRHFSVYINGNNTLTMVQNNPNTSGASSLDGNNIVTDGEWHFISAHFQDHPDRTTVPVELWLNGKLEISGLLDSTEASTPSGIARVGGGQGGWGGRWSSEDSENMEFDEVAIFEDWLNEEEVQNLYTAGVDIITQEAS